MDTIVRVIDFETTGMEPPASVIEVGICDLKIRHDDLGFNVGQPRAQFHGCDHIPPEVRAVHHIHQEEVANLPPFVPREFLERAVADGVQALAAHQAGFEEKFLCQDEFPWICTYKCALRLWPDAPSHSNQTLRYWLEDRGAPKIDEALAMPPHRAGPDAYVTAHILQELLRDVSLLQAIAWTKEPRILPRIPIGKQRGAKWADVDAGFLSWMLRQADMDPDLQFNARRELIRRHE